MKKIVLIICLLITGQIFAQTRIEVSSGKTQLELTQNNREGFSVQNSIAYFDIQLEKIFTKGEYIELKLDGYGPSYHIGNPDLPVLNRLIEVPLGATVEVNILSYDEVVFNLSDYNINKQLLPSQESVSKSDDPATLVLKKNETVYKTNRWFSNPLARFHEEGVMRGVRFGRLEISPFVYNPVSGELKLYNNLKVEVKFTQSDFTKTEKVKKQYYSPAFNSLFSGLLNYNTNLTRDDLTLSSIPMHFVIISDRMFEQTLAPFIAWKKKQGFLVTVRYTDEPEVGSATTSIKSYLQALYTNSSPAAPAPAFVALVGDVQQIPAFNGTAGAHKSDLYYATYDGASDIIPDLFIGRMSAQTVAQLETILYKTLIYEQFEMEDPSYLARSLTIGGYDTDFAPLYGNGALNYMAHYLNAAHGIAPFAMYHPCNGQASTVIGKLNQGVGIGVYTAHCDWNCWGEPYVTTSNVNALTNSQKWGLLIGNCCLSAKFDQGECFGEAVIRAADKGGVGYIGGSNNTYWDEDYWWATGYGSIALNPQIADYDVGSFDALFHENGEPAEMRAFTGSQLNIAGLLAVNQSNSYLRKYYWEIYHFLGDPTLMPFLGAMPPMNPSHTAFLSLELTTLAITDLAPNSYVALTDNGELKAAGFADNTGTIELEFEPFTLPTTADLTATTTFFRPYFGTIEIIPAEGPYVVCQSYTTVNEDELTYISTHSKIDVTLKNVGVDPTSGTLTVQLSCDDPLLTINNATAQITSVISGGGTTTATFVVTVDHAIPNHKIFPITITVINDEQTSWVSKMNLKAYAPVFSLDKVLINGEENGKLDAGTLTTLTAVVKNTGGASAFNLKGEIEMNSDYITFACKDQTPAIPNLPAGESRELSFTIISVPELPSEHATNINLLLTAQYEISATKDFTVISSGTSCCVPEATDCKAVKFNSVILEKSSDHTVLINNQDNICTNSDIGYEDYTHIKAHLEYGQQYIVKVKIITSGNKIVRGWFDLNGNNIFEPEEELIDNIYCTAIGESSQEFTIPANATPGAHRFRLRCSYGNTAPEACDGYSRGQTHDYTIVLPERSPRVQHVKAAITGTNITVTWMAPAEETPDGYNIYRNGNKLNSAPLTGTTFTEPNVKEGIYVYHVTAVYGADESFSQMSNVICTIFGINDYQDSSCNLYPNPTTGELTINNEQLTINSIEVFDIYGKKTISDIRYPMSEIGKSEVKINIGHLPAGIYFVKISTQTGEEVKKVVKM